jgi:hypothetical protein
MKRLSIQVAAASIVAAAVSAGVAQAGTMVVYSCHTPSGRPVATDGWTLSTDNAAPHAGVGISCSGSPTGSIRLELERDGATVDGSQRLLWTFRPPQGTTIREFTGWVCGRALALWADASFQWQAPIGIAHSIFISKSLQGTPETMGCQGSAPWWSGAGNAVRAGDLASPWLEMDVSCAAICDVAPRIAATIELSAFRASIDDPSPPTVGSPTGSLTSNRVHTGVETVTFSAADRGVGLFRALAEVRPRRDGPWLQIAEARLGGESCRPLGETSSLYEFSAPAPCPAALGDVLLSMDNTRLGTGEHDFRVVIEDAAGNRTVVWQPESYVLGAPVSRPAQLKLTARAARLDGRLLDAEANPIAGGRVVVESREYLPKSHTSRGGWTDLGAVVTNARGEFSIRIPKGPSRTLRASYVASDAEAVASTDLVVPAQITVRALRTRVRNGKSVVFRGRVVGPIPAGGLPVSLEAHEPGRWVPVATTRRRVRTSATGRFTLRYRFRRTFRPTNYRFRVVTDEDSAFPYTRGTSRSMTIRVRP